MRVGTADRPPPSAGCPALRKEITWPDWSAVPTLILTLCYPAGFCGYYNSNSVRQQNLYSSPQITRHSAGNTTGAG